MAARKPDDCLKILRIITSDVLQILQYRPAKLVLYGYSAVTASLVALQSYYFLFVFNTTERNNYAPFFFLSIYDLAALMPLLIEPNVIAVLTSDLPLWPIDCAGIDCQKRIKTHSFILSFFGLYILISSLLSGAAIGMFDMKCDGEFIAILKFSQDFLSEEINNWKPYLWTITLGIFFGHYVALVHALHMVYLTQHVRFQLIFLEERFKCIDTHCDDEQICQEGVANRLKDCIRRHIELANYVHRLNRRVGVWYVSFILSGCLVGTGMIMLICIKAPMHNKRFRLLTCANLIISGMAGVFVASQSMQNQVVRAVYTVTAFLLRI